MAVSVTTFSQSEMPRVAFIIDRLLVSFKKHSTVALHLRFAVLNFDVMAAARKNRIEL